MVYVVSITMFIVAVAAIRFGAWQVVGSFGWWIAIPIVIALLAFGFWWEKHHPTPER